MHWVIAKNVRCTIQAFSGPNFSGYRSEIEIFPSGRQGELDGSLASLGLVGSTGVRVTLCESPNEEDWESRPWRSFVLTLEHSFETQEGKRAVRVPDIDAVDDIRARRTDPDFVESAPHADSLDTGRGWTYGRTGSVDLKGNVQMIRVDKAPKPGK